MDTKVLLEIQVKGECLELRKYEWGYLRFWSENDFIDRLPGMLGKTKEEVRLLLDSYKPVASRL